jgi:hypothetical protein
MHIMFGQQSPVLDNIELRRSSKFNLRWGIRAAAIQKKSVFGCLLWSMNN